LVTIPNSRSFWGASSSSNNTPFLPPSFKEQQATPDLTQSAPIDDFSTNTSELLATDSISDSVVDTSTSFAADVIAHNTIPPLQYGDLADLGLIGWSPSGLVRWSLEVIQVSTDMPWFWTIVAGTIFWRLAVLPITIKMSRNGAIMNEFGDEFKAATENFRKANQAGDKQQRAAAVTSLEEVRRKAGINPFSMVALPFLQVPIAIGVFLGIKGMCELPVEQLKYSGLDFLPDLTAVTSVADPYWILPITALVMMNFQMKVRGAHPVSYIHQYIACQLSAR
jgi:YidC/Oxa1 family membrane protein insertase